MTFSTTPTRQDVSSAAALTCEEVRLVFPCPLCGCPSGEECEHELSRLRAALRWAEKHNS